MATSADYLAFVLEQLPPLWDVRSRKMFGEYMVYLNENRYFWCVITRFL